MCFTHSSSGMVSIITHAIGLTTIFWFTAKHYFFHIVIANSVVHFFFRSAEQEYIWNWSSEWHVITPYCCNLLYYIVCSIANFHQTSPQRSCLHYPPSLPLPSPFPSPSTFTTMDQKLMVCFQALVPHKQLAIWFQIKALSNSYNYLICELAWYKTAWWNKYLSKLHSRKPTVRTYPTSK